MPRTTPSTAEIASVVRQRAALAAAAEHNHTAERVLRALEVIVLSPSTAPTVAEAVGVCPRTARRILQTLTREQYVERRGGRGRGAHLYQPTVRLLAMAAQLAVRLPLVQAGERAVAEIEQHTGLAAYVATPCYDNVVVVVGRADRSVRPGAMIPATDDAAGRVLLAHRGKWRQAVAYAKPKRVMSDSEAARVVEDGYAVVATSESEIWSQAVPVLDRVDPLAALAVRGRGDALLANSAAVTEALQSAAATLAATIRTADAT